MAYTDTFNPAEPAGSSLANTIDDEIRSLKVALIERLATEHYNLSTATNDPTAQDGQGRHIAGAVGCFGVGTFAERAAMEALLGGLNPGNGAIWLATENSSVIGDPNEWPAGTIYIYETGTGWVKQDFSAGTIYATQAEVDAGVAADRAVSPATLRSDTEYIALTTPINTPGVITISGLTGTGIDTDQIRALCVTATVNCATPGTHTVTATFPDTTVRALASITGSGVSTSVQVQVPVSAGTASVTFANSGVGTSFSLHGVIQRTNG